MYGTKNLKSAVPVELPARETLCAFSVLLARVKRHYVPGSRSLITACVKIERGWTDSRR